MSSPLLARSGLSLDRLASFVEIADASGLAAASEGDPVRQSQLSRQLKDLEEFFGLSLIERRRGVFRLTEAGQGLYDVARHALTQLDDFERRCNHQSADVHLGAGESTLVWLVVPRLQHVFAGAPRAAFTLHNLQSEEISARLRDGRLDFGILRRTADVGDSQSLPLGEVRYALFLPQRDLANGQAESLSRLLSRLPFAALEGNNAATQMLSKWTERRRGRLNIRLRCTSLVQVAAAVADLGMAAVLPCWCERAFTSRDVTRVELPALKSLATPLRLVWTRRQAAIRPFLGSLAKELAAALTQPTRTPQRSPGRNRK